jgi:putative membrane protein
MISEIQAMGDRLGQRTGPRVALPPGHRRFTAILAMLLGALWLWLAIDPVDRQTWVLENALFVVFVVVLGAGYRHLTLSRLSYALIFVFLCLHALGAHYTYSLVPYDDWSRAVTGHSVSDVTGWQRNHYDRLVHLLFGLLLGYPAREVFVRVAGARGFWGYLMPLLLMMSFSLLYELIEWGAALVFGGDLGVHYLGTQGDEWDGHRDMALATLGALLAMLITAAVNAALQRDFAREWHESLRVKQPEPLGEVALAEMLEQRRQAD